MIATYEQLRPELDALLKRFATPGRHRSAIVGLQRLFEPVHPLAITGKTMGLDVRRPRWFDHAVTLLDEHQALATVIVQREVEFELAEGVTEQLIEQVREHLSALPRPPRHFTSRVRR